MGKEDNNPYAGGGRVERGSGRCQDFLLDHSLRLIFGLQAVRYPGSTVKLFFYQVFFIMAGKGAFSLRFPLIQIKTPHKFFLWSHRK